MQQAHSELLQCNINLFKSNSATIAKLCRDCNCGHVHGLQTQSRFNIVLLSTAPAPPPLASGTFNHLTLTQLPRCPLLYHFRNEWAVGERDDYIHPK